MMLPLANQTSCHTSGRQFSRPKANFHCGAPNASSLQTPLSSIGRARRGFPEFSTRKSTFSSMKLRAHSRGAVFAAASADSSLGVLISKSELPAFLPREDVVSQTFRWAGIQAGANGERAFGMPIKVEPYYKDEGSENERLWGIDFFVMKGQDVAVNIRLMFDDEVVEKYEFVGIGEGGFPVNEGRAMDVEGKHLEIWKVGSDPVDPDVKPVIRALCEGIAASLAKYYAFGSSFTDDAT